MSVTYRKPAAATVASGKCGDSAKWTLDAEGTLTISGTGRMYDYEWPADRGGTTPPWLANKYRDSIRALHVEQGITYIGRCAFDSCGNLSDVTLPTSLRIIGQCAFNDCTALRSIQLEEAFIYYNNLATVRYGGSQSQWSAVSVAANAFPDGVRYVYNVN